MATLKPLHVKILCSRRNVLISVLVIWLVSAIFGLPNLDNHVAVSRNRIGACRRGHLSVVFVFKLVEMMSFYMIPLVLLTALYARIARLLWTKPIIMQVLLRSMGNYHNKALCSAALDISTSEKKSASRKNKMTGR